MDSLSRHLADERRFLDKVFDASQDGIFFLDRDFTILHTNRWMEDKYAAHMPLAGKTCHAVFREADAPCASCPYLASLETGRPHVERLPYPSAHAPNEWFELSMVHLTDDTGATIGAVGHIKDVTDRNQAAALLKDEINRRRILVGQSRDGIVVLEQGGRVFEANPEFARMLGYTLAETHRLYVWDWGARWNRQELLGMLQSVDDQGDHFETRHRRKDGTIYDVEISTNGAVYRGQKLIFCVCRDITERVSERKRIEEALRLTQFSFDNASIGIIRTNQDAQILNANRQACRNLGYNNGEVCRLSLHDIDPGLSPEDGEAQWRCLCEAGSTGYESVHRRKDGTLFPVHVTANLLTFEGRQYAISFIRDITEKKKEEKQRAILEAHLRQTQRLEALGTLAGGIAHDFNNILSAIFGYTQLAQLRCADQPKLRNYIDQIFAASVRAKNLVQQILIFSRQGESVKRTIDIGRVVDETVDLIRATVPPSIEIRRAIQADAGDVYADETQVHQLVMNLCTNAYHAMQAQGGLLEVDLCRVTIGTDDSSSCPVISPGRYVKLTVADTGHGMDPDTLARIFDPYFTTKKSGEGTGMGLSIVHGIVKDHGGSMKVYSRVGVGTTFQVFVPLIDTTPERSSAGAGIVSSGSGCILFVDDERQLTEIGNELLEGLGYLVETRSDPVGAMEAFRMHPDRYDLVITDMTMPNMTGDKLAQAIRAVRPDIPIILCTGFEANLNTEILEAAGIDAVLLKPVTLSHLTQTVRRVLDAADR